ncbi:acyltransferase domain-containing protein [Tessaracoccus sp.]
MDSLSELREKLLGADLERLGFRPEDATEFRHLVQGIDSRPDMAERVEAVSQKMRRNIGDLDAGAQAVSEVNDPSRPKDGLIALLALVSVADDVHREHERRGVPEEVSWKSLSDLGQQVHIHRCVHGRFGLSSQDWCAANYTGRLLWLGRLQFALQKDRDHAAGGTDAHMVAVHIPESGPLTPEEIDDSLRLASQIALPAFKDYAPQVVTLHSWLLDPGINAGLNPESNMVKFTRRFELYGESTDAYRDALFFGFHIEPGGGEIDLDSLPQTTSLQRAIVTQLKGDGVGLYAGRLKDWPHLGHA